MSVLSVSCCALLSAVCAFTLVSAAGCGTDAKGVDDCRDIEQARCDAAQHCGIVSKDDVAECQRFYRDQCLHGLQVASPGSVKVNACVSTIRAAGACAATSEGNEVDLASCDPPIDAPGATTACDVVREPEKASSCSFLLPPAGAGGSGGTGSSAGTGGTSGAGTGNDSGGSAGDAGGG